jgi:putative hydrolase of the HAD superfamily
MRGGIEGVAFDLDGTLYPNYRFNIKLVPFLLKESRLLIAFGKARQIIRKEQENSSPAQSGFYDRQAEITAEILGVPPEPLKEKIDLLIYKGWEPLFKNVKLFKNAAQTLAALKKAGFKLGLLSDFPPETKLEYLNISGGWDAVLCSEQCGALKPHPLPFAELAKAMSLPCEKILYVGNSRPYDVKGAQRAGMKTAWIKSPLSSGAGKKKPIPDFTFSDYRKLYDYMLN